MADAEEPSSRHDWLLSAAFVIAVAAPMVNSLAVGLRGWVPFGDDAIIGTRALDVGTHLTPLVGMPSSFSDYVPNSEAHQLGPLWFWILSPPVHLFGITAGLLIGTALLNGAVILAIGLVAKRTAGPGAALVGLMVALLVGFTASGQVFDPINSAIAVLPFLLVLVLAWAVAGGDAWLMPVLLAAASFVVQADLEYLGVTLVAVVWALGALAVVRWRARRAGDAARPGAELHVLHPQSMRRPGLAVIGVVAVCWSGPLVDALRHRGGNLRELQRVARAGGVPLAGWRGTVHSLSAVLDVPPFFLRHNSAADFNRGLGVTALAVCALGLWLWDRTRRRRRLPALSRLLAGAGVVVVAVGVNGYRIPVETFNGSHLLWLRVVGAFVWFALALGASAIGAPHSWVRAMRSAPGDPRRQLIVRIGAIAVAVAVVLTVPTVPLIVAAALLSARRRGSLIADQRVPSSGRVAVNIVVIGVVLTSAVAVAWPPNLARTTSYGWTSKAIPPLSRRVRTTATTGQSGAYLVTSTGGEAFRELANGLVAHLRDHGVATLAPSGLVPYYGPQRAYVTHRHEAAGELLVMRREARHPPRGSRLVASYTPPGWDQAVMDRLQRDIAAFVRSQGSIHLDLHGSQRVGEVLAWSVPGTPASGQLDNSAYQASPQLVTTLPPFALTELYSNGLVSSPALPARLQHRLDSIPLARPVAVYFLPAPLPEGAGTTA